MDTLLWHFFDGVIYKKNLKVTELSMKKIDICMKAVNDKCCCGKRLFLCLPRKKKRIPLYECEANPNQSTYTLMPDHCPFDVIGLVPSVFCYDVGWRRFGVCKIYKHPEKRSFSFSSIAQKEDWWDKRFVNIRIALKKSSLKRNPICHLEHYNHVK